MASLDGGLVVVNTLQAPQQEGQVYVTTEIGGSVRAVQASQLTLVGWSAK
ncbi:hypothetical protein Y695_00673 [Hydrogenophaga sp. T4]|jgi:hypothetical protein|nr:hypothetical protein Y695_00673 [Hydrogenophaga sp. T4]MBU4507746.1 hypothetical protein [Gammaproteobacteria bacterium]